MDVKDFFFCDFSPLGPRTKACPVLLLFTLSKVRVIVSNSNQNLPVDNMLNSQRFTAFKVNLDSAGCFNEDKTAVVEAAIMCFTYGGS